MTDYRTATEKTIHMLVIEVIHALMPNKIGRVDFVHAMGKLRDVKKILDYKELGCPMGVHSSACLCSHNVICTERYFQSKKRAA